MIKQFLALFGLGAGAEVPVYKYSRYMQPIITLTRDADALDNSQIFLGGGCWDNGTEWRFLYTGQSAASIVYAPDGLTYVNVDQMFLVTKTKSNDVRSGWTKQLDVNGDPKPIFQPTFIVGRFDRTQVWMRTIIKEGSTLKGWYTGDPGAGGEYKIGLATSTDDGLTWTRHATTEIYSDPLTSSRGIVVFIVLKDTSNYKAFYGGIDPNVSGSCIAQSTDGIAWTKTHSGILAGQNLGWIWDVKKIGSDYYVWTQKDFQTGANFGPARTLIVYKSSDLTTWVSLGPQMVIHGSNEFGLSGFFTFQKPNGDWFAIHNGVFNAIEALAGVTLEPFGTIKVSELNRSDLPLATHADDFFYPQYVRFHAPLGHETGFVDLISGNAGTISGIPTYAQFEFIKFNGAQVATFPNSGVIDNTDFGVKIRTEIVTTGTHELFSIGTDIVISLVSGKLRVQLSSNGSGYEKDYITTVNISKPTGLVYIDNHIYVGFTWIGGVLTLYNDFAPFTVGQLTKTVDNALTTVNNSGDDILIGQNATLELRSVSIMGGVNILMGATDIFWGDEGVTFSTTFGDQQFIDLEI